jgi:tetratricopeptide (TPR) repeat protein
MRDGKLDEALAVYQAEIARSPRSSQAHQAAGVVLDLLGRTEEARRHFNEAIEVAPDKRTKYAAWRAMAMSYAFDNDCANTWKYEKLAFDSDVADRDYYQQGERANEAARVCLEAGDLNEAERLYQLGAQSGMMEPDIKPERVALWNFRMIHAMGRIAARRGNHDEARQHVESAKAILASSPEMAKDQQQYLPYLVGYVTFYAGDYDTAINELKQANENDPFIQSLLGLAYEKKGDKATATSYYEKAASTTGHNPPAAFARPFASRKLRGE